MLVHYNLNQNNQCVSRCAPNVLLSRPSLDALWLIEVFSSELESTGGTGLCDLLVHRWQDSEGLCVKHLSVQLSRVKHLGSVTVSAVKQAVLEASPASSRPQQAKVTALS